MPSINKTKSELLKEIERLKRQNKRLQENETRYRYLFEMDSDPVFLIENISGKILDANKAAVSLYGYTRKELLKMHYTDLSAKHEITSQTTKEKPLYVPVSHHCTKDGKVFPVEITANHFKYKKHNVYIAAIRNISTRIKYQKTLDKQRLFLQQLINLSPNAVYVKNIEGIYIFANESYTKRYRLNKDKVIDKTEIDVFPNSAEHKKNHEEDISILSSKKELYTYQEKLKDKSGKIKYYSTTKIPVKDLKGKIHHVLFISMDITKQKLIEFTLREKEESYRSLVESSTDPVYVLQNNKLVMVNNAWLELFGYSKNEVLLEKFDLLRIVAPVSKELVRQKLKNVNTGKMNCLHYEMKGLTRGGRVIDIEVNVSTILWNGKKAEQGIYRDVTNYKRTQEALRREASIFDNLYDAVVITDLDGKILNWNAAATRLYGYGREEILDTTAGKLRKDVSNSLFTKEILDSCKTLGRWQGEINFRRKDGYEGISETIIFPFLDVRGDQVALVAVNRDITERKNAEKELRESEERFRQLFNYSPISIFEEDFSEVKKQLDKYKAGGVKNFNKFLNEYPQKVIELAGLVKLLDVNNAALTMYKARTKDEIKEGLPKLFTEDSYQIFKNELIALWNGKSTFESEATNTTITGEKIDILLRLLIVPGYEKTLSKVLVSIVDITENKKWVEALLESEDKFRKLTEKSLVGIYLIQDNEFKYVNPKFAEIVEYSIDELVGKIKPEQLIAKEDWPLVSRNIAKRLEGKVTSMHYEFKGITKTEKRINIEVYSSQTIYNGKPALIGSLLDITYRKIAEEKLRKLSQAVEQSPSSIIITDKNGKIEYVNPRFTLTTGYTFAEVIGKNPNLLKPRKSYTNKLDNPWKTILSGKEWRGEFLNKKKNGQLFWESSSISPIRDSDRNITHFLAINEDITEKKRIEIELIAAKEQAEESDRLKSEFLAQMSHEIRSPLNVILSYNGLLKEEISGMIHPDYVPAFTAIDSAGKRLLRTINLILNMAAVQTGVVEAEFRDVNLFTVINNLLKEFKYPAEAKEIEFNFNTKCNDAVIFSDEYIISEILQNIIGNAVKYTHRGSVNITLYDIEKDKISIDVKDTGIGMSKAFLSKIFLPFTQEESGYSRKFEGNGLGLALVKNYIEMIDADIKVKSEKGKGSCFTITLKKQNKNE